MTLVVTFRALDAANGCTGCAEPHRMLGFSVRLRVIDESGQALPGAVVRLNTLEDDGAAPVQLNTGLDGMAQTPQLRGPAVAVVEAKDHLPEPVPLGASDAGAPVDVKLFARKENRFAMHSAGDVMFGRRYAAPEGGQALIPPASADRGAEQVVSAIAPVFSAADLRTVNLESVLTDMPSQGAYPRKRFILQSNTATTAGLRRLGVDCAVLANNHSRDFLDQGIADTRAALTKAGIAMVGADATAAGAAVAHSTSVRGTSVGIAAFTSVDGDFVNGAYPTAKTPRPSDVQRDEAWQYEERVWGFTAGEVDLPAVPRRIGKAWDEYRKAEPKADRAALWASLVAVYPELQDWVARRGHGGAAMWDPVTSPPQIAALSAQHQLSVVQLHAGFQFEAAASENVRTMAHAAIDAGADIVIGHHPHVLQGLEWYKGKLIVYSLGNFVFDQDFLATFSSMILRTVWEGDRLLEARLLPLELVAYRPVAVTGDAARRVLGRVWERSLLSAATSRDSTGAVRAHPQPFGPDSAPGQLVFERNTARVTATASPETTKTVTVPARQVVDLGVQPGELARPVAGEGAEVGRDLFGWGSFEDDTADGGVDSATHWNTDSGSETWQTGPTPKGHRFLHMNAPPGKAVQTRAVSRIPLPRHRLHVPSRGASRPLDPDPSYSMRAMVRGSTKGSAYFRLGVYSFDDTDPTEDPTSVLLKTITRAVDVPADGGWHEVTIDLSPADLDTAEGAGNMVMMYAGLHRRSDGRSASLDLDDVRFMEWRDAGGMTGSFGDFTLARNTGPAQRDLSIAVRRPS
ncbi:poly-gamma-glutamate capsule biosynthesis protein CapA/YwtB (metallophosphatase superfamily) [Kibdelosporangium banguiense]|uniref:Poly-gamma-glutamate capsule biosynthesis protein CapA/YwtB (Metallophosphatase superfamily) n=1 Tax=Kibdelosporangium banguiense TaxID=1365924 RepID=A0ABS4TR80_9PSEU|nr:CapA family protein [Kibdelosporangium banguiense]MBP2326911.1 poly-gamma-glutamate capsule biosynthesis protein CapA/YwtB (metallophosphatase superfamily) [Kibdelosporangium banguiense]